MFAKWDVPWHAKLHNLFFFLILETKIAIAEIILGN